MGRVVRNVFAVIAGFIAASAVMMLVEWSNGHLLYPDLGKSAEGVTDREKVRELLAAAPVGALIVVLMGWALGSMVGGFLAALISRHRGGFSVCALTLLLTLAGIANNLMLPPPVWFWVPTIAVFVPAVYLGARLISKTNHSTNEMPTSR